MDHLGFKLARAALQDVAGNQSVTENENVPERSAVLCAVLAALGKQAVEKRAVEDDAHAGVDPEHGEDHGCEAPIERESLRKVVDVDGKQRRK